MTEAVTRSEIPQQFDNRCLAVLRSAEIEKGNLALPLIIQESIDRESFREDFVQTRMEKSTEIVNNLTPGSRAEELYKQKTINPDTSKPYTVIDLAVIDAFPQISAEQLGTVKLLVKTIREGISDPETGKPPFPVVNQADQTARIRPVLQLVGRTLSENIDERMVIEASDPSLLVKMTEIDPKALVDPGFIKDVSAVEGLPFAVAAKYYPPSILRAYSAKEIGIIQAEIRGAFPGISPEQEEMVKQFFFGVIDAVEEKSGQKLPLVESSNFRQKGILRLIGQKLTQLPVLPEATVETEKAAVPPEPEAKKEEEPPKPAEKEEEPVVKKPVVPKPPQVTKPRVVQKPAEAPVQKAATSAETGKEVNPEIVKISAEIAKGQGVAVDNEARQGLKDGFTRVSSPINERQESKAFTTESGWRTQFRANYISSAGSYLKGLGVVSPKSKDIEARQLMQARLDLLTLAFITDQAPGNTVSRLFESLGKTVDCPAGMVRSALSIYRDAVFANRDTAFGESGEFQTISPQQIETIGGQPFYPAEVLKKLALVLTDTQRRSFGAAEFLVSQGDKMAGILIPLNDLATNSQIRDAMRFTSIVEL